MTMHAPARRHLDRRALLPLLLFTLVAALLGTPALASNHKNFTWHVDPLTVPAGLSEDFTVTLVNGSTQHQLGSADITVPTDIKGAPVFTLTAVVSPPTVFDATGASQPKGTASQNGNTIPLRNLGVPPGGKVEVAFTATAPCAAGDYDFLAAAKQSNNFQGPPGNNLDPIVANSDPTVTVTGDCDYALEFVDRGGPGDRQPKDAEKNTPITSEALNPDGAPVQVEVVDGTGARITSWTGTVTIAIAANPSGGTLSGTSTTTPQPIVDGVATFTDLKINLAGIDYELEATSTGLKSATSDGFTIYDDVAVCEAGRSCETNVGNLRDDGMRARATGVGGASGGTLAIGLNIGEVDCGDDHNHFPKSVTVDAQGVTDKVAEVTIAKAVDQAQPNNGVAHYQVCLFAPNAPFTDRFGNESVTLGLLPDCGPPAPLGPPCVESKTKKANGDVVIIVHLGSPMRFR